MNLEPKNGAPTPANEPAAALAPVDDVLTTSGEPSRVLSAFSGESAFIVAQRMAKALSSSSLLPETFRNNIPNCMIAMELANRIGCSVFMICQNMDVIHGRPGLRAKFLIATVNASGRFEPLRFKWEGKPGTDDYGCRAYSKDLRTGVPCEGPLITWGLAKSEGWVSKSGSKWKTMPEKMFMYRAGAWWTDLYCPEFGMGMGTAEEAIDTYGEPVVSTPAALMPGTPAALEAALTATAPLVTADGEVLSAPETAKASGKIKAPVDDDPEPGSNG
jgi:hypothetical protein